jgi:hypothetical protein
LRELKANQKHVEMYRATPILTPCIERFKALEIRTKLQSMHTSEMAMYQGDEDPG